MQTDRGVILRAQPESGIITQIEAVNKAISRCSNTYRIRHYQARYCYIFGECEKMLGRVTVRGVCELIITGSGQVRRILNACVSAGLLLRIEGEKARSGYWILTDKGHGVCALFRVEYLDRVNRVSNHLERK